MSDRMNDKKISRRSLLKGAAALAGIAVVPALVPNEAWAAKVPKAAMQYRDKPKGDAQCSKCIQFIPGKSATANGTCKVVQGSISPNGWCLAYAPKS